MSTHTHSNITYCVLLESWIMIHGLQTGCC